MFDSGRSYFLGRSHIRLAPLFHSSERWATLMLSHPSNPLLPLQNNSSADLGSGGGSTPQQHNDSFVPMFADEDLQFMDIAINTDCELWQIFLFFLRDFIFKKTLFEKLQY